MNEYTRREEVQWTFAAAMLLVICVATSIVRLLTAEGPLVPDSAAAQAAEVAEVRATQAHTCAVAADKLATEVGLFKQSAEKARLKADTSDAPAPIRGRAVPKKKAERAPDAELGWGAAALSHKQAKLLAPCRGLVESVQAPRPETSSGWDAVAKAAAVDAPADGDKQAQITAASKLLAALQSARVDALATATSGAEATSKAALEAAKAKAATSVVRAPLPKGALPREVAVCAGVALALASLLVSFLSARAVAMRRAASLAPLRQLAATRERGLQAAEILKLAAQHNGGEPGLVVGAALGGLIAALVARTDADVFVGGVMAGLPVGLGFQWVIRLLLGASRWRARAAELGETEKPAIPIVLVLTSVNVGLEAQFMQFFSSLSAEESAATVEKLAVQAEERILANAEANKTAGASRGF